MADTHSEYKDPEEVIRELLDLDDVAQARIWIALRWYAHRLDIEPEDLYQEAVFRILNGTRNCSVNTETFSFFNGVAKSITSEYYEKNKRENENKELILFDNTFWGNQKPLTPDKVLMIRRDELVNIPDGLINRMFDEAQQNSDSEVEQYLIHSLIHGLSHPEIVSKSNWNSTEAQTIQRRASRLKNRHIEQFKAKQKGG